MTELSPQAQAVWDAAYHTPAGCSYEYELAAALEAVADEVAPGPWRVNSCCDQREHSVRGGILAIAAELRGTTATTETP